MRWEDARVLVAGVGVSGFAAADALLRRGARVVVVDRSEAGPTSERAGVLEVLGADVRLGAGAIEAVPDAITLVVASPGWRPDAPLLVAAEAAGIPVWSEIELAWHLRPEGAAPWLALTGTNGKTTTVEMLAAMLVASGKRAVAAGNVGLALVDAVTAEQPYDVIAVELSSFQLHRTFSMSALASAVLNIAEDHVDWHSSMEAYARDKGRIYQRAQVACVYNVADPWTERLVVEADVVEGCRAIGFTLGVPSVGMVGVVDDILVDRAFVEERATSAAELATLRDVIPNAPHNVANALAAAALARAYGVPPVAVRDGLRGFRPGHHRIELVAVVDGVSYVDDSKATNPHAAAASLRAYDSVVWIAGGLVKGATFDELVPAVRSRLRGVVVLGADRAVIADALARHAPEVPVVDVASTETDVMTDVVRRAAALARPGDTVLLAPAAASMDLFRDYAHRGDAFAEAVRALATEAAP
ncbi:MAG TPA: UDP-N-acetylmuramoyl-L-alanine--D-glutamate ligase [Actinomycetes bacterium]|nr:UDP-N-acetylmuramoyl-L-alanine--D-glutamate ligase [Actinomycetes bacterium]